LVAIELRISLSISGSCWVPIMMRPPCTGPRDESDTAEDDAREARSSVVPQESDAAARIEQRATRCNRDIPGGRCKFHAAGKQAPGDKKRPALSDRPWINRR
jgi:hypothetical protein